MDVSEAAAFVKYLKHQRLILDYVEVASCGLLIYDYLLTIGLEIKLIWYSPWNYTKVLFFLARYLPIINVYFMLHNQMFLDVNADTCGWIASVASWLITFGMYSAEIILTIRTWAVWRNDQRIGVGLAALLVSTITIECIYVERFLKTLKFAPIPYSGFRGCFAVNASGILSVTYISVTFVELVVLVLMVISAFRAYRSGNNFELLNVIHRDAILFYFYHLCLSIFNVVILLVFPKDLETLLLPAQSFFASVFVTRIIINIRSAGRGGMGYSMTELHDGGYNQQRQITMPLAFRPGDQLEDEGDMTSTINGRRNNQSFIENMPIDVA